MDFVPRLAIGKAEKAQAPTSRTHPGLLALLSSVIPRWCVMRRSPQAELERLTHDVLVMNMIAEDALELQCQAACQQRQSPRRQNSPDRSRLPCSGPHLSTRGVKSRRPSDVLVTVTSALVSQLLAPVAQSYSSPSRCHAREHPSGVSPFLLLHDLTESTPAACMPVVVASLNYTLTISELTPPILTSA